MRARLSKIGQGDSLEAGYGLFDDGIPVFSSGTPWFAFDTMDFRLTGGTIVEAGNLPASRSLSRLELSTTTAFSDVDYSAVGNDAATALPAGGIRSLMSGNVDFGGYNSEFAFDGSSDDLISADPATASFAALASATTTASTVPVIGQIFSGAFEYPAGATIEAGFSVLDLVNIAPLNALNQGDTFYMFDQGESFSLARIEMSADIMLNAGRDPFELTSYVIGDTDNDGVNDYVIRIDKGGPTLLGTDFLI